MIIKYKLPPAPALLLRGVRFSIKTRANSSFALSSARVSTAAAHNARRTTFLNRESHLAQDAAAILKIRLRGRWPQADFVSNTTQVL
jgi:hypothetical protein